MPFEEVNTLGGEFELDEVTVIVPVPVPEAIKEDGSAEKEPAPAKEVKI